ncbi:MAG: Rab family GTPase [Candidatus Hodarchaeota archaeon]
MDNIALSDLKLNHYGQRCTKLAAQQPPKIVFKVLLCGSFAVGKTSLVFRFVEGAFKHKAMATVGANFLVKKLDFRKDGVTYEAVMQLWDVSGTIRDIQDVAEAFFLGAKAVFFVHDLSRDWTREDILDWHERVTTVAGEDILSTVIGNKLDLVTEAEEIHSASQDIAERIGAGKYFLTSAKTGSGVSKAFEELANEYCRKVA